VANRMKYVLLFSGLLVCTLAEFALACTAQAQPASAEQSYQVLVSIVGATNTFTPTNTATYTPTPTDTLLTPTPIPTCCNNVTGSAYAHCEATHPHELYVQYTLDNYCDHPVVGSGSLSLELRRISDGVWVIRYSPWSWDNYPFHTGYSSDSYTEVNWVLPPEYDAIRTHLHVTGECWEVDVVSAPSYPCYRGVNTYTPIPTNTDTPVPTDTYTPTPAGVINGHLTWQGVADANRPLVTGTLALCVSGSQQSFGPFNTDTNGFFTITTNLPDGVYHWFMKGGRHIANSSPTDGGDLVMSGRQATQEFGTQKSGNTDTNNIVNATDFGNLKVMFSSSGVRSADFDYNLIVSITDFNILKLTFGQSGHTLMCP
jgi:hypothetical protein